jgi:uncharacterized protein (TIGR03435 family)
MLRPVLLVLITSVGLGAQSPTPSAPLLEVISVKPVPPNSGPRSLQFFARPGGSFTGMGVPLGLLLNAAYDFPPERMVGAPKWRDTQLFDISARGRWEAVPPIDGFRQMVRQILVERFRLKAHTEQRPTEVYALVLARDGKPGPRLRPADDRCEKRAAAKLDFPPPRFPAPGQRPDCGSGRWTKDGLVQLRLGSVGMPTLISQTRAREAMGRLVVDRTGLQGRFDVELDYVPDQTQALPPGQEQARSGAGASGPSLTTALREQLGFRFEKRKEPVDVLVIDHVEMPTPN